MQKLIIVAALVACALAGPIENIKETFQTVDLTRPSPINPDILSDPKPEEKVTIIEDSAEDSDADSDEETKAEKLPGPYVPRSDSLSRSKRADKDSSESEEDSSEEDKSPSPPVKPHSQPSSLREKLAARTSTTTEEPSTDSSTSDGTTADTSTSSTTVAPRRPYAPLIHQHNEHRFKPTTEEGADSTDSSSSSSSSTTAVPSVVGAAAAAAAANDHPNGKRDIPVPLTRKYHHKDDEETKPKTEEPATDDDNAPEEEVKQETEKDGDHKPTVPASHPALIPRPIPVAELFAKKHTTEPSAE